MEREENEMTREEKITKMIQAQQLLTFEEWFELNKYCFILAKNANDPRKMYEEYVAEHLGE